jgi:hypothetical protein
MNLYPRSMRTGLISAVAALAMMGAGVALAQNVHLKPPNRNPTFNDKGLTLEAAVNLAGLSNEDLVANLSAQANATATCTNPGSGGTQPPGQNPAPVTVQGSTAVPSGQIKNGNVSFTIETAPPVSPIPGAPGCPNPNWIETITDLSFTSAVITIEQPAGTVVLTVNCTFTAATSNGAVPTGDVSCTVS